MTTRLQYGTPAKIFHWLIVVLLAVQYPIGWLMPDLHPGTSPGASTVSYTHLTLPTTSMCIRDRLYALVLATTISGWLFASFRGWSISFFYLVPLPMLASDNAAAGRTIDGLHQAMELALLVTIGLHVGAALVHIFVHRDRVMQRMLPG
ncbi:cytochrome b [Bradyrhizobium campsiandrae]|uniref:Cytochrome b/b6 domain-containing protein n=1 Tax=Bradyrhizobium campsiandrae TaxID=1729892 RepID=A0ABR7UDP9_9BRAD|nr:cytochrome b/b6 domain-containing protein [Bradyrhizobium campsiandrae]MBC9981997.1 cytochrome b/b6 domain-containing protein [Bradyrhizobium campsiandrae]